ncbi:hypothetical protein [Sinimarinibacterium thermocellulolyticum]|uniref:Lipoprotein n=1 Tax=Sinimarinibacterium thermocellulolyticum TaxID=3170016 RepID=A0ABV2A992_9GAMM
MPATFRLRQRASVFFASISLLLAACGSSNLPDAAPPAVPGSGDGGIAKQRAEWIDGRLSVDVPVPVVTFGLSAEQAAALQAELQPYTVDHANGDLNQSLPPDIDELQSDGALVLVPLLGESFTLPVLPTALYQVTPAPAALVAEFEAALAAARLSDTRFDAIAMEDFLAAALPRHGFALNPDAPSMVILHLAAFGVGEHGWKVQGTTGFIEPVRLFGDRKPLLILDPSAVPDPYGSGEDFANPLAADDAATMANFVREATEYRMLQGSIYPVSTAPCHAVTGIMGVRQTSIAQATPLLRPVEEALVAEHIAAAFQNLTGGIASFDLKILQLPQDDPVLDALTRGEFPAFEVLRAYLSLNFDRYHVDHPGCEEYLSIVVQSDLLAVPGGGVIGIGTYDDSPGQRISMSWVHDIFRLTFDPESPVGVFAGEGKEFLNWWEYLFSHETGHILGQRHPHDITSNSSSSGSSNSFSSIWSSMSYQQDGRMIDFGANDQANWRRNRAGYALLLAAQAGREGSAEWQRAMDAASRLDWTGVWRALQ